MNNNIDESIERRELTPFDMMNNNPSDKNRVLDLDSDKLPEVQQRELSPSGDLENDPNVEPVEPNDGGESDPNDIKPDSDLNVDPEGEPKGDEGDGTDDEEGDDEYDVKIKANLAKYAAEALMAQGALPEDFEISEDITEQDLDAAYVSYKEETLRNQVRQEELSRLAEEEGITPEMIQEMKLKHYGVQDPDVQELNALSYLSSYQFDEKAETFEDDVKQFLHSYYTLKEISESRIPKMVERDLEDEELLSIITEAQKDLGNDFVKKDSFIKEKTRLAQEKAQAKKAENREKVNQMLSQGGFAGRTKEELEIVRKALFDKTEIVVGPDGKRYKTTLYYKRQLEAQRDLEKNLQSKIDFILGGESTTLKNNERQKTTKKLMNRLNSYVDVNVKPKKNTSKRASKSQKEEIRRVEIN